MTAAREGVSQEVDGHVLLMGINRPRKRNAFDLAMLQQLAIAYERLALENKLRAGVLFAHGDHFSAGLDLSSVSRAVRGRGPEVLSGGLAYDPCGLWGEPVPKPVVLAVQGIAYTLSIELALAADIVVATEDVEFRQLEAARGILPFGGATYRAPARLGWGNAMRYLLTTQPFGAEEARRIGLVQEVVPTGLQVSHATEIAHAIAAQAPLGIQATLANARAYESAQQQRATEHLKGVIPGILSSGDAAEGLASFVERRTGRFDGR